MPYKTFYNWFQHFLQFGETPSDTQRRIRLARGKMLQGIHTHNSRSIVTQYIEVKSPNKSTSPCINSKFPNDSLENRLYVPCTKVSLAINKAYKLFYASVTRTTACLVFSEKARYSYFHPNRLQDSRHARNRSCRHDG